MSNILAKFEGYNPKENDTFISDINKIAEIGYDNLKGGIIKLTDDLKGDELAIEIDKIQVNTYNLLLAKLQKYNDQEIKKIMAFMMLNDLNEDVFK
jgi:hypothetical protein